MGEFLDLDALRDATPGCHERVHLNNAGAALPTRRTLDTVIAHLELEARIGGYEAAAARSDELHAVRVSAAALLGADAGEIAVTTSDTAAWTKAFWGFVHGGGFDMAPRVVVDRVIYNSHHFAILQARQQLDLEIDVIGVDALGTLDLDELERALEAPAGMVTLTHVPTQSGLVNPVEAAGERIARTGVPFFLDACQSIGQLPVDVRTIGCDVLTGTGRKWLRGPRGTGLLYVRDAFIERLVPPGVDASSALWASTENLELAADATRFGEFEFAYAAVLGLGSAIDQVSALGIEAINGRIALLADHLRAQLDTVPGLEMTDGDGARSGIVTFTMSHRRPADLVERAASSGINIGASSAAFARLDMDARGLDEVVRVSPHVYNTTDELDQLVELI